jgi:spore germination protein GerM
MQDHKKSRFSIPLIAVITGVILAAGGGAAWWAKSSLDRAAKTSISTPAPITQAEIPTTPEAITQEQNVEICWLNPTNNRIELASSTMTFQKSVKPERVLEKAFETLLAGPKDAQYTTTIPKGTKLLNLEVDQKGVHVNLSQEFLSGGGSASMSSRLAQVIYTATSSNGKDQVWINVDGKPLESLGGEGIIVNQPMTRENFKANFTL